MTPVTDPEILRQLDGMKAVTDKSVLAKLNAGMDTNPTAGNSFLQNFTAGYGKAAPDVALGVRQMTGNASQEEVDASRRTDAPLMNTWGGRLGNVAGNVMLAAPTLMIPGANTVTGAGVFSALQGLLQPVGTGESRTKNTAVTAALGAGGQKVGGMVADEVGARLAASHARAATARSMNAERDAVLKAGQEAGLVVPPATANPTATNKVVEGFGGKLSTAQAASGTNQVVINRLAAQHLGLPPDQPITRDVLKAIRTQAGQAYEAVKQTGMVQADQAFTKALDDLVAQYQGASKAFPSLARNDVADLVRGLKVQQFGADAAVDAIKVLRETADTAFGSGNKALGKTARGAADAMEDMLGRHLQVSGAPSGLMDAYRNARATIAKTYTVDGALNPATGTINAAKLAADLKKGRPLTGELDLVARFAQAFPKATQPVERMGSTPGASPLDWFAAIGSAAASGNPAMLALAGARPAARSVALSAPYQGAMTTPSYTAPHANRLLDTLLGGDRGANALRLTAPAAYQSN